MKAPTTISITPPLVQLATVVARDLQCAIGLDEPWTSLNAYLDAPARVEQLKAAELTLGLDFRGLKILELGSGMGMLVTVARKLGLDVTGIEPSANSYRSLHEARAELLRANALPHDAVTEGNSENLPWPDDTFDVVLSFQVLEHVRDPQLTISEAIRVLKPGGRLYFDMPNYLSFVEGHYGTVWCPLFAYNKKIAKAYIYLNGRNPKFINELNFVTPSRLRRWIPSSTARYSIRPHPILEASSPSSNGVTVITNAPKIPAGQRFTGLAGFVRRVIRRRAVKLILNNCNLSEHIILEATK
jgi:SAM-dependent methyltransferase